jgi:hypothetical protein
VGIDTVKGPARNADWQRSTWVRIALPNFSERIASLNCVGVRYATSMPPSAPNGHPTAGRFFDVSSCMERCVPQVFSLLTDHQTARACHSENTDGARVPGYHRLVAWW